MDPTPAGPERSTTLAEELCALDREFSRLGDHIDPQRAETAAALVRAAADIVGQASAPVDRDVLALLRVTAACAGAASGEPPDTGDVAAGLTLIARTVAECADAGRGRSPGDTGLAHVHATLAHIAGGCSDAEPGRDSSRSADMAPVDDA